MGEGSSPRQHEGSSPRKHESLRQHESPRKHEGSSPRQHESPRNHEGSSPRQHPELLGVREADLRAGGGGAAFACLIGDRPGDRANHLTVED